MFKKKQVIKECSMYGKGKRDGERERESITNLGGAEKRKSDRRDDPGF